MYVVTVVVSVLLALALTFSGIAKLRRDPRVTGTLHTVGVTDGQLPVLAGLEIAAALGLVVGLFWWPIGVAAAVGVVLYFVGAVLAHLRVHDSAIAPAAVLGLVAVAALVLRLATR